LGLLLTNLLSFRNFTSGGFFRGIFIFRMPEVLEFDFYLLLQLILAANKRRNHWKLFFRFLQKYLFFSCKLSSFCFLGLKKLNSLLNEMSSFPLCLLCHYTFSTLLLGSFGAFSEHLESFDSCFASGKFIGFLADWCKLTPHRHRL